MKHISFLVAIICLAICSAFAQNEWTDGSSSPNNITDNMYRQGNVGIGTGFTSTPPPIPFAVDMDKAGTKATLGGQDVVGSWYGTKHSVLEIQSNFEEEDGNSQIEKRDYNCTITMWTFKTASIDIDT